MSRLAAIDYHLVFELIHDGLLVAAGNRSVLDANPAACRILQLSRTNVIGSDFNEYWDWIESRELNLGQASSLEQSHIGAARLRGSRSVIRTSILRYALESGEKRIMVRFQRVGAANTSETRIDRSGGSSSPAGTELVERPSHDRDGKSPELWAPAKIVPITRSAELPARSSSSAHAPEIQEALTGRPDHPSAVAPSALCERLTPREFEVLQMLAQGLSNRQIARRLVISPGTAKLHVHRIITKLEVCDRTQAAILAINAGTFGFGHQDISAVGELIADSN